MTSATGQTRPPVTTRHPAARDRGAAFTLIEITLALVLIVIISTLVVINVPAFAAGHRFESGVSRFAAALRMMRAEAVIRGRQMRMTFDDQGQPQAMWEPDPLNAPGQFEPFTASTWTESLPRHLFRVSDVQRDTLTRSQVMNLLAGGGEQAQTASLAAVNFYPDGTADSATITLVPTDNQNSEQATVTLDGTTGQVHAKVITLSLESAS